MYTYTYIADVSRFGQSNNVCKSNSYEARKWGSFDRTQSSFDVQRCSARKIADGSPCWLTHEHAEKRAMLHIWLSDVAHMVHRTHVNESCHTHEWAVARRRMGDVAHMNEPRQWVISHIWMRFVAYERVRHVTHRCRTNVRTSHVAYRTESCRTCEWVQVISHIFNTALT